MRENIVLGTGIGGLIVCVVGLETDLVARGYTVAALLVAAALFVAVTFAGLEMKARKKDRRIH